MRCVNRVLSEDVGLLGGLTLERLLVPVPGEHVLVRAPAGVVASLPEILLLFAHEAPVLIRVKAVWALPSGGECTGSRCQQCR